MGGENIAKQDAEEINIKAFEDAGGKPEVLVFTWARSSFDAQYQRRRRVFDYFKSLGARSVGFANYSDSPCDLKEKVACSDLVYLTGGVASVLVERLKTKQVDGVLRHFTGVIVGRSAGALALCRRCVVTLKRKHLRLVDGLGYVDFCLKAHYKPNRDDVLRQLSWEETIYAVPERAALVYDGSRFSFLGDLFLFEKGEKRALTGA